MRYTELRRSIEGISQKMLTETLRLLERDGFVRRTVYAQAPPRVDYELTALGRSLERVIGEIRAWAEANVEALVAAQHAYDDGHAQAPRAPRPASLRYLDRQ